MSSVVPFGVFDNAMNDMKFHSYDIPKEAWVSSNNHFIHNDSRIWEKPEELSPDKFLTADGKTLGNGNALEKLWHSGSRHCFLVLVGTFSTGFPFD